MPLETALHIASLVATNPAGADDLSTADDHIRLLKDVLVRDLPLTTAATALGISVLTAASTSAARTALGAAALGVNSDISYTGTLTGGTGVVNLGSGQVFKDASGNVGIGTNSPTYKLDVQSTTNALARVKTNTTGFAMLDIDAAASDQAITIFKAGGVEQARIFSAANEAASTLVFARGTGATESMRIDPSGNLLVGQTSAYSDGTVGTPLFQVRGSVGTAAAAGFIANTTGAINMIGFINPNGTVGSINVTGSATAYNTSSDYRLKDTIAPMTGALAKVSLLKPCTYKWKVDGSDGQGFIAHEINEVVPGCASGTKDAVDAEGKPVYQGIDTSFLVATLTAAIQELKAIVDTQAARITALEAK